MAKKPRTGHLYKRGNVYWLRYIVDGKPICKSLKTTNGKEAEKGRDKEMRPFRTANKAEILAITKDRLSEAEKEKQTEMDAQHPPLKMIDAWDAYVASKKRPDSSERTLAGYESSWNRFMRWMKETYPDKSAPRKEGEAEPAYSKYMQGINVEIAEAYAEKLESDKVTASTFNQHIGLLKLMWKTLAKDIKATENPWLEIRRKKLGAQRVAHRHQSITQEQFESLLNCAGSTDLHDLLFAIAWTGQRLADVVLMEWTAIDFKHKVISIHPMKLRRTGKQIFLPLLPQLDDLLKTRKKNVAGPYVFPELVAEYKRDTSMVSKRIQAAFDKAKLKPHESMPGVSRAVVRYGAHSLRHYFVTQALVAGIPSEIVKAITGHASDAMFSLYQHVDARLMGKLAAEISAKPVEEPKALPAPEADNAPLPSWALKMLDTMTAENWESVRREMKKIGKKNKKQAEDQKTLPAAN